MVAIVRDTMQQKTTDTSNTIFSPLINSLKDIDTILDTIIMSNIGTDNITQNTSMIGGRKPIRLVPTRQSEDEIKQTQMLRMRYDKGCTCTNVQNNVRNALSIVASIRKKVMTLKRPAPEENNQDTAAPLLGGRRRRTTFRRSRR